MAEEQDYTIWTLSNGLEVLFVPDSRAESVYIHMTGKVGRRAERDDEGGAAHFLEHLFFDGTKKRPSALEVNRFIEAVGGTRNGYTGIEEVGYHGKIINDNAEHMFDFISDIFQNSLLEEFEKEQKVIAQESAQKRDDPLDSLMRYRLQTIFSGQPIGRTIFDEEYNLPNMTPEVIRAYQNRNYVAENFLLGVGGKIDIKQAEELAETYFSSIPSGDEVAFNKAEFKKEATIESQNRDIGQSKIAITFEGVRLNHDTTPSVSLMRNVLGIGTSSRLFNRLRHELELAYHVSAQAMPLSDTGAFTILTFVDESNLQYACDVIVEEIQKLLNEGITDQELERAKNLYLSGMKFASENYVAVVDKYVHQYLLTGKVRSMDQQIKEIEQIGKDDVVEAARQIFSDQPKVNIITPSVEKVNIPKIT